MFYYNSKLFINPYFSQFPPENGFIFHIISEDDCTFIRLGYYTKWKWNNQPHWTNMHTFIFYKLSSVYIYFAPLIEALVTVYQTGVLQALRIVWNHVLWILRSLARFILFSVSPRIYHMCIHKFILHPLNMDEWKSVTFHTNTFFFFFFLPQPSIACYSFVVSTDLAIVCSETEHFVCLVVLLLHLSFHVMDSSL